MFHTPQAKSADIRHWYDHLSLKSRLTAPDSDGEAKIVAFVLALPPNASTLLLYPGNTLTSLVKRWQNFSCGDHIAR